MHGELRQRVRQALVGVPGAMPRYDPSMRFSSDSTLALRMREENEGAFYAASSASAGFWGLARSFANARAAT